MSETTNHESFTTSTPSPLRSVYASLKTLEFRTMMFKTASETMPNTEKNQKEFMWAYRSMVDSFISDLEEGLQYIVDDDLPDCEESITLLEEKIAELEKQIAADTKQKTGVMIQEEDREIIHTAIVYGHLDIVPGDRSDSMTPDEKEQLMNAFHRLKLFLSCPAKEAKPVIESLPLVFKSLPDDRQQSPVSNAFFYSDVVKDKLIWFQNVLQSPLPEDTYKRKSHSLALIGAGTHILHNALHSIAQLQKSLLEGDDLIKKIESLVKQ